MRAIPIFLIFAVILSLSIDSAQGWGRWRRWRFRGRRISNWIRKGIGCKLTYKIGCPAVVGAVTSGLGAAAGKAACAVKASTCKRTLEDVEQEEADTVDVPFDNVFVDYDDNEDGQIDFDEFYLTVTNNIPIANPALLGETFMAADANNDGSLDQDEFNNAPLDFGDADSLGQDEFDGSQMDLGDE